MQTEPQNPIPLVYKITDPLLFSTTYYVRAIVRNSLTGDTLNTVNLTRNSTGTRYTGQVNAPADPTGLGLHIDITISSYSDSGYSTYADGLPEVLDKYWVRSAPQSFGGFSSGSDVDYKKIKEIVKAEISSILTPISDNIKSLLSRKGVNSLEKELKNINKIVLNIEQCMTSEADDSEEEDKPMDFSPILTALATSVNNILSKISENKFTPTNLNPVLEQLVTLATNISSLEGVHDSTKKEIIGKIEDALVNNTKNSGKINKIKQEIKKLLEDDLSSEEDDISSNESKSKPKGMPLLSSYIED